jgi:AraC family transcriptional regulator
MESAMMFANHGRLPSSAAVLSTSANAECEHVAMSSRGLGWSGLKFERCESRHGLRELPEGSRHHLIFVGLSTGRVSYETAGQSTEHEVTPGCVLVMPAHTPLRAKWSARIGYSLILLEPGVLDRVAHEVFGLSAAHYRLVLSEIRNDAVIANIAGVLAREALSRDRAGSLYSQSLANILSVHLLRNYATGIGGHGLEASALVEAAGAQAASTIAGQPRAVAQALQFIHQNYARELTLSGIAAAVNLSPFHLARLFKRTLGVSPYQHVLQVRVTSARSLLAVGTGGRSLAEIAAAVGFADQSHLTRHFKRITGLTPRQFRMATRSTKEAA